MENYFTTQRDNVFRNVEVLIYVFDVESREVEKDMHYYQSCLEAILQVSLHSIPCTSVYLSSVEEILTIAVFKCSERKSNPSVTLQ